jgi:hypothetical protein
LKNLLSIVWSDSTCCILPYFNKEWFVLSMIQTCNMRRATVIVETFLFIQRSTFNICNSLFHSTNILSFWFHLLNVSLHSFSLALLMQTLKNKNERSIVTYVLLGYIMRDFPHLVICNDDDRIREKKQTTHCWIYVWPGCSLVYEKILQIIFFYPRWLFS